MGRITLLADLPDPPFLQRWLVESSLVTAIALVVVGAILWFVFMRRAQSNRAWSVAGIMLLIAAGIYLAGAFVTTDRERIEEGTHQFIDAIFEGDAATARELLAQRVVIRSGGEVITAQDRGWLLAAIEGIDAFGITDRSTSIRGVSIDGPGVGRSRFYARVQSNAYGGPHPTTWELTWTKDASGAWRIDGFDWLTYLGNPPNRAWMTRGTGVGSF